TVGALCLGDNNVVIPGKAYGIAVMDWCGVAGTGVTASGARTGATCARVAVTTSTCATVIATGVVRCRRIHIPMNAVQRIFQRTIIVAVVCELTVLIQPHKISDRLELTIVN